ncbi:MAG: hypothetical protein ABIJ21_08570 [Nanoarchaeota archaeon]
MSIDNECDKNEEEQTGELVPEEEGKKSLEEIQEADHYYGPTTPEEVDDRKEHPERYQAPHHYYGPTTPEEVDDRRENAWAYQRHYEFNYRGKWPDD